MRKLLVDGSSWDPTRMAAKLIARTTRVKNFFTFAGVRLVNDL
jgi:hypothetical protein